MLQPKVLLVHPSLVDTAKSAIIAANVPNLKTFLFSDRPTESIGGLCDWRSILGTSDQGDGWEWKKLGPGEAEKQIAAINFSSGCVALSNSACLPANTFLKVLLGCQREYALATTMSSPTSNKSNHSMTFRHRRDGQASCPCITPTASVMGSSFPPSLKSPC